MKNKAQRMVIFILSLLIIGGYTTSFSQELSSEEKEAWKLVKTMADFWAERNLEGYMSCLHENFVGWFHDDPMPLDKNSLQKFEKHWLSTSKIHVYEDKPVSIKITDNIAIINSYSMSVREDEKEKKIVRSRWTEVLKKENGKWLILSMIGRRI
jgi:hypothetical protein